MKILLTVQGNDWNSPMDPRFGRAKGFLIYDEANESLNYVDNEANMNAAQGAGIQTAQRALEIKPDVIITGNGPGGKAAAVLKNGTIKIYAGAEGITAKEAYDAYKEDKLQEFYI